MKQRLYSLCRWAVSGCNPSVVAAVWFLLATVTNASGEQTVWDLQRLARPPVSERTKSYGAENVQAVLFAGEPWKGKPTKVFAYYGFPAHASKDSPVPGVVCVHGGSGTAFAEWVQIWNRHGFAAIAIDTNGAVPKSINENPDNFRHEWAGPMRYGFGEARDDVRDQWPYHAVADIILANSLLRSFPEVDPENIGITGISWGGYLTSLTAGIDRRFKFAIPVYGCGFLDDGSTWQPMIEAYGHDRWMKLWDPSSYLGSAQMPMLWINGTNDKHYHLGPFQRSYRLPTGARSLAIRVRMDHGHGSGWSPPEIYAFAKSVVGREPALAKVADQARQDRRASVSFEVPKGVEITAAELVYTSNRGPWVDREWKTKPATIDQAKSVTAAEVPSETAVYFFNLTDSRGLLVSSEHVEVSEE